MRDPRETRARLKRGDESLTYLNRLPEAAGAGSGNPFMAPDAIFNFQKKCNHVAGGALRRLLRRLIASNPSSRTSQRPVVRGGRAQVRPAPRLGSRGQSLSAWRPPSRSRRAGALGLFFF